MGRIGDEAQGLDSPAGESQRPDRTLAEAAARRRRVALAGHQGDSELARSHLTDDDAAVRATALRALARAGALRSAELAAATDDADPSVRRAAAEVLAVWTPGPGDQSVTILGLLGDHEPTVVETAAWAAGERPIEPGVIGRLAQLGQAHADALVREAAVAALGALGDPSGLPTILAATTDKATVRRRAVIALAPFEGPEVDAALSRARTDRDWQVRQAAEDLLDT
jgi:HEAT repeat protein